MQSHCWGLINDNNAHLVTEVHELFSIGVVARAEGVSSKPLDKIDILHNQWVIQTLTTDLREAGR